MAAMFSKKFGYGSNANEMIYEDAPQKLRIGLCNHIEDCVRSENLPWYSELYLLLTAFFKDRRKEGIIETYSEQEFIEDSIMNRYKWYEIFDLIEYLFSIIRPGRRYIDTPSARYHYTVDINRLMDSEYIGWYLSRGKFERRGSEYLDKETIQKVRNILINPVFAGPSVQFNKAVDFLSKRPAPDKENSVKEAVGALEGVARILLDDKNITLGKAVDRLVKENKVRKPFDKIFHALYGFASSEPGVRHAAIDVSPIDIGEAWFVLYSAAACMILLCDKYGYKPIINKDEPLETDDHPDPKNDDDIPF